MLKGLWIGASGMTAQAEKIDVIANNLANIQTTGYKKQNASFSELLYQAIEASNQPVVTQNNRPITTGAGARVASISKVFTQGPIIATGRDLDLAIDGQGFFEVVLADGTFAYTRDGNFRVGEDGSLINSSGYFLSAPLTIPPDYQEISIAPTGEITVVLNDGTLVEVGVLPLCRIENTSLLQPVGQNLYVLPEGEDLPELETPGSEGLGLIRQGYLESSNVDLLTELTQLITAQRAYQFNSRSIQTADEMWNIANNLRR